MWCCIGCGPVEGCMEEVVTSFEKIFAACATWHGCRRLIGGHILCEEAVPPRIFLNLVHWIEQQCVVVGHLCRLQEFI